MVGVLGDMSPTKTLDTVTPEMLKFKQLNTIKIIRLRVPGITIQCITEYKMLKAYNTTMAVWNDKCTRHKYG